MISPFLGFAVDKLGGRAVLATLAPFMLIIVHATLGFTGVTPIAPLVGQGLAYSIFAAALWPSVPFVVNERYVGTAYGLLTAVQNGGMALFPVIVGQILSECNNNPATNATQVLSPEKFDDCQKTLDHYKWTETFFVSLAALGFFIGLYLNIHDWRNGWVLNGKRRKGTEAKKAEMDETEPLIN